MSPAQQFFPLGSLGSLGRCLLAVAVLVDLHVASAQTYKFPDGQTPTEFQGFVTSPGAAVGTWSCVPGSTHSTHSTYAACCVSGQNCQFFTECIAGTATRLDGASYVCSGTIPNCYTMTIYQSFPSAAQSWSAIGCAPDGFDASTVYREIVEATTTTDSTRSSTSSATTPSSTSSTPVETGTGEPATTSQPSSSSSDSTSVPAATGASDSEDGPETSTSSSKAWIAGAVIGPLAGVALAGFLAFWLGRRRGRREATGDVPHELPDHYHESPSVMRAPESTWSPSTVKSELAAVNMAAAELPDHRPSELDSYPARSYGGGGYDYGKEYR